MAASVGVATARVGEEAVGRTVTAAMSFAISPPAILVSIANRSRLAELVTQAEGFSYAVLAEDQEMVGDAFAGWLDAEARFHVGIWDQWPSGHPRLLGAATALDCEVIGAVSGAEHTLFVGAVAEVKTIPERKPLMWHNRQYKRLAPHGAPGRDR
ncbi:flavin reductase [Amorphus sp. 3PC139-8]